MNKLQWLIRVTRPAGFMAVGLATWTAAIVSNGPNIFSTNKVAATVSMALLCLAASVFHFGAANKMYARKVWDIIPIKNPWVLITSGLSLFAASLLVAWNFLPHTCALVIASNIVVLILYSRTLSARWWTKNWCMAYICSTPMLLGWLAGSHPSPLLPPVIGCAFCLYWSKEIIKDVHDIRANCGIRVTLPIRFGIRGALRVGAILATLGTVCSCTIVLYLPLNFPACVAILLAIGLFGFTSWKLFFSTDPGKTNKMITVGSYCLIASILFSRL